MYPLALYLGHLPAPPPARVALALPRSMGAKQSRTAPEGESWQSRVAVSVKPSEKLIGQLQVRGLEARGKTELFIWTLASEVC